MNWKTTTTAVVMALANVLNLVFKIQIPADAINTVAIFLIGIFAADGVKKES